MMNALLVNNQVIEVSAECMQVLLQVARSMSATVPASAPTAPVVAATPQPVTPKVYDHVSEDFADFEWHCKDNAVNYTHKDGSWLHEQDVRRVLNARLKAAGFVYNKEAKAWLLTTEGGKRNIKGAEKFVGANSHEVTADERNAIRDGWTEKSAKRASKATK